MPSLPNPAVRRFARFVVASLAWKMAAILLVAVLVLKLTGGF